MQKASAAVRRVRTHAPHVLTVCCRMLQNNALQGTIPASLGNLQELEVLYLERNPLTGVIPKSVNQLPKLKRRRIPTGILDEA